MRLGTAAVADCIATARYITDRSHTSSREGRSLIQLELVHAAVFLRCRKSIPQINNYWLASVTSIEAHIRPLALPFDIFSFHLRSQLRIVLVISRKFELLGHIVRSCRLHRTKKFIICVLHENYMVGQYATRTAEERTLGQIRLLHSLPSQHG